MERVPLPDRLVEQNRAFESGEATPAEPRNAATVVLLRSGIADPEVYLMERQTVEGLHDLLFLHTGGAINGGIHEARHRFGGSHGRPDGGEGLAQKRAVVNFTTCQVHVLSRHESKRLHLLHRRLFSERHLSGLDLHVVQYKVLWWYEN